MAVKKEQRTLKMHPRLLWDVIHRQAGSLPKAILEGVMNSIDAGATRCDVEVTRSSFSIVDDGKGFKDEEEITNFFETFGHPHEEGDAKYGRFRMGRGQMFAFGKNEWRTNHFGMVVDLKPQKDEKGADYALGYSLTTGNKPVEGCQIKAKLYDTITPSFLDAILREITDFVRFAEIPVTLNGKLVSTHPSEAKWDIETDDAYIKLKATGDLQVFNMGVLVCKYGAWKFGTGGIVASKTALDVNFARNDVQSTCKVWKRISKHLDQRAAERANRKAPLNDYERENLLTKLAAGALTIRDLQESRVITDVTGSHHPFSRLQDLSKFSNSVSIAPRGDRVAERAHVGRLAFVVTPECAANLGATTPDELVKAVKGIAKANGTYTGALAAVDPDTFHDVFSDSHEIVPDKDLGKDELRVLKAIREGASAMFRTGMWARDSRAAEAFRAGNSEMKERRIEAGISSTAHGWTNGTTHIWLCKEELRNVKDGMPGMVRIAGLLLHEYLHNEPDTGTHEHGIDFYERFHNLALDTTILGDCANAMMKALVKELRADGKRLPVALWRTEDLEAAAEDAGMVAPTAAVAANEDTPAQSSPEVVAALRIPVDAGLAARLASPEEADRPHRLRSARGQWASAGREPEALPLLPGM